MPAIFESAQPLISCCRFWGTFSLHCSEEAASQILFAPVQGLSRSSETKQQLRMLFLPSLENWHRVRISVTGKLMKGVQDKYEQPTGKTGGRKCPSEELLTPTDLCYLRTSHAVHAWHLTSSGRGHEHGNTSALSLTGIQSE